MPQNSAAIEKGKEALNHFCNVTANIKYVNINPGIPTTVKPPLIQTSGANSN